MTNALDNTDVSDDDWASALAESKTTTVDNAPSTPIEADEAPLIFQKLAKSSTAAFEQVSDIDLILDIPVHLTVQLGSTRRAKIQTAKQFAHDKHIGAFENFGS